MKGLEASLVKEKVFDASYVERMQTAIEGLGSLSSVYTFFGAHQLPDGDRFAEAVAALQGCDEKLSYAVLEEMTQAAQSMGIFPTDGRNQPALFTQSLTLNKIVEYQKRPYELSKTLTASLKTESKPPAFLKPANNLQQGVDSFNPDTAKILLVEKGLPAFRDGKLCQAISDIMSVMIPWGTEYLDDVPTATWGIKRLVEGGYKDPSYAEGWQKQELEGLRGEYRMGNYKAIEKLKK